MTAATSNWLRVNRRNPCPVCGKPDWCLIAYDGKTAIRARIESYKPAGHKGAGWIHALDNSLPLPSPQTKRDAIHNPKAAPIVLDTAYRALLSELTLSESHHENLWRRGLSDAQITGLGYRTWPPNGRRELAARLQVHGVRLAGVPGFYLEHGQWQLAGPGGIATPVTDTQGRVVGLQVRCDNAERGKYRWVSSRGFDGGCSSGTQIHVAGRASANSEAWITEGALKADIAALKLGRLVLAVAGVGNWQGVMPIIAQLKPERVIVAFDMDKLSNPAVKLHSEALMTCLIKCGIRTFEADWDIHWKGLDDLLTEGTACRR